MRLFANSPVLASDGEPDLTLAWLAGLLEAEGTFLRAPPSKPGCPIVHCRMTDRDVIERASAMIGASVGVIERPPFKTQFATSLKCARAVSLMLSLGPLMSDRRAAAIAVAIESYSPPDRKLDYAAAEEIRDLHAIGSSVSWLASVFCVARSTIRQVIEESIYFLPPVTDWRSADAPLDVGAGGLGTGAMTPAELYWLAGWLEGEGSFLRPPPSDPKRPRICGETRDQDVAEEVGRLLGVTPTRSHTQRARRRGWSPTWKVTARGGGAISVMTAVQPLMGARRQSQIDAALLAVRSKRAAAVPLPY